MKKRQTPREIFDAQSNNIIGIVYRGTVIAAILITLFLLVSLLILHNGYVVGRTALSFIILGYLVFVGLLIKKHKMKTAAWLILVLYSSVAAAIMAIWSVNATMGILILGFIIFLSSIILGTNYIIYTTIYTIGLLLVLQIITQLGVIHPDISSLVLDSTIGDIAGYSSIFIVFAIVAWIAGRQIEHALFRAQQAEIKVRNEKTQIALELKKRTELLKQSQLKEIEHIYRFAELGQQTSAIVHELANYLSVLSLDIDDLKRTKSQNKSFLRIHQSVTLIDRVVNDLRLQIKRKDVREEFDISNTIESAIRSIRSKATRAMVRIEYFESTRPTPVIMGDPSKLTSIITILINNAIDAYKSQGQVGSTRAINLILQLQNKSIDIKVRDWGPGIDDNLRKNLFKPVKSTKDNGSGIGLYIAHQIVRTHFNGTLQLSKKRDFTEFIISIPSRN